MRKASIVDNVARIRKAFLYVITHRSSGRVYVGKSVNPKERWKQHRKLAVAADSPRYATYLRSSMAKHGVEEFSFAVVEEHPSEEAAYSAEVVLIARLRANDPAYGFNLEPGGRSGKKANPESVAKGARSRTGQKRTPEQRRRMSEAVRPPMSPETCAKIGEAVRARMATPEAKAVASRTGKKTFGAATAEDRARWAEIRRERGTNRRTITAEHLAAMRAARRPITEETRARMSAAQQVAAKVRKRPSAGSYPRVQKK